jgi:hypothetical protein
MLTLATTLPPHPTRRLGRQPKKHDKRTLQLAKYLPATLPAVPDVVDWSTKLTNLGPMLNNILGDCAIAAPGHAIQTWSSETETEIIVSDPQVLKAYQDVSGYDGTPATDTGCNMLDVAKYCRTTGIGGKTIDTFAILEAANLDHVDFTINAFGGVYAGLNLPLSCQNQISWAVSEGGTDGNPKAGSWGGHAIWILGRDKNRGVLRFVSWGLLMEMTYEFWEVYGDESYAFLSTADWAEAKLTPSGFDVPALRADLLEVTS